MRKAVDVAVAKVGGAGEFGPLRARLAIEAAEPFIRAAERARVERALLDEQERLEERAKEERCKDHVNLSMAHADAIAQFLDRSRL